MNSAQAKAYREENRSWLYRALDEEFEQGEMTALEYRRAEAEIDSEYPE